MPPRPRRLSYDSLGILLVAALVVVFCLLLLRHDPSFFWVDDYQISILPVFADVARSWSEGTWPLLSPYSWVCSNLAGEFQYGTFSLFVNAAIVAIWKFPLSFPNQAAALSTIHLVALSIGGYLLARGRDLPRSGAVLVGLVATLNGWIICWGASDWFGALAAFTWLPWSWWALEKAAKAEGSLTRVLLPAPFIYLLIAGGFPYTILNLGLVTAWLCLRAIATRRDWLATIRLGVSWLLGLGLSAPAWMALFEYSAGSRRAVEVFRPRQWLVPFQGLPGLLLPGWTVKWHLFEEELLAHPAVELACGVAPVVILLACLFAGKTKLLRRVGWELGLLLVALGLCMIPSAGVLRFSFRWLALFHLVLGLCAAEAWRLWNNARPTGVSWLRENAGAWSLILVAIVCAVMAAFHFTDKNATLTLPLVCLGLSLVWWIGDALLGRHAASWLPVGVAFATLLASYCVLDAHATTAHYWFSDNLNSPAPLGPDRLYLSIYPAPQAYYRANTTGMPYGATTRPGSTAMFSHVHVINGYSPIGPAGIDHLFDFSTHGQINPRRIGEVVIPEARSGGLLEKLGIDGLIVAHQSWLPAPLPEGWQMAFSDGEADVYHRTVPLPRVVVWDDPEFSGAKVNLIENSRQRVVAEVSPGDRTKPVRLIFARPYFPGYLTRLNGKDLPVSSFQGLAPAVDIPPGESGHLELIYRPRYVTLGGAVAAATLLAIAGLSIALRGGSRL